MYIFKLSSKGLLKIGSTFKSQTLEWAAYLVKNSMNIEYFKRNCMIYKKKCNIEYISVVSKLLYLSLY